MSGVCGLGLMMENMSVAGAELAMAHGLTGQGESQEREASVTGGDM